MSYVESGAVIHMQNAFDSFDPPHQPSLYKLECFTKFELCNIANAGDFTRATMTMKKADIIEVVQKNWDIIVEEISQKSQQLSQKMEERRQSLLFSADHPNAEPETPSSDEEEFDYVGLFGISDISDEFLNDGSCFDESPDHKNVFKPVVKVNVRETKGKQLFSFDVEDAFVTIDTLKVLMVEKISGFPNVDAERMITPNDFDLKLDGSKLAESLVFAYCLKWGDSMVTLEMSFNLKLSGGGLIRKPVKREDALKNLLQRSMSIIKKDYNHEPVNAPDEVKALIEKMRPALDEAQVLRARGVKVIKTSLKTLSDENLTTLLDVMKYEKTGRREGSVERIQKCFGVIFPRCFLVNDGITALNQFQAEMSEVFLNLWVQEYASVSSDSASFNNQQFVADVKSELDNRRSSQGYSALEQSSNCNLMWVACVFSLAVSQYQTHDTPVSQYQTYDTPVSNLWYCHCKITFGDFLHSFCHPW